MLTGVRVVGILALQGGFHAHANHLRALGAAVREVRRPSELEGIDALVLPGGESTTIKLGVEREGLAGPLTDFVESERPVFATCAGAILLGRDHLSLLDIDCARNAYGPQTRSFEADLQIAGIGDEPFRGLFIRAPQISRVGDGVSTLARHSDLPVAVQRGNITACTFHPELTDDNRLHRRFFESLSATRGREHINDRQLKSEGATR